MNSAVVIVNWNSGGRLRTCIESLLSTTHNAEIVVVDNASTDGSLETVGGRIIRNTVNRGFAAAVNQGFEATASECVLVMNPDIRVRPGSVQLLEGFLKDHPKAGAAGGYVNEKYLPREFPSIGSLIRENLGLKRAHEARRYGFAEQVDQPAAAALMVRREAYKDIGGFDEQFYPAWYEDVDFCRRLKAKSWEIYFVPKAEFVHEGGYSAEAMGAENFLNAYYGNQSRYARKHFGSAGAAAVRASIAAGMVGRIVGRPKRAASYAKALVAVLKGS